MWRQIVQSGDPSLASVVACRLGENGRALGVGAGISLADELAAALLRRAKPGDDTAALLAIERGRAVRVTLSLALDDPELAKLRSRVRRLDAESRNTFGRLLDETPSSANLTNHDDKARSNAPRDSNLARVREQAQKELFGHFDQLGGAPPVIDLNAITAALRPDTAVCVVVVAEHDAHAVIVGRASDGAPHTHSLRLTGFNRTLVDSLLLNVDAQPKGLLDAIARLQVLGPHPDEASFSNAVALFSNLLKQCEGSLASILIDPIFSALERGFGERVTRICWSVPPCMWPLPLHAFPTAEPSRPRIQTYGRSINEIASLSRRVADGRRPIRRVLAVDDPCDDMQAKSPFLKRARDTIWTEIKHATPRKILRGLESADTLLFHGHGCWNIGDPDRSGLIVLRSSSGSEPGVLPFTTLRRLRERPRDVAVLSACDVGAIELFAGADDFEGMPSELLDAGFSCVVAATWPVHQDATAELMTEFMSQMFEERLDPAAALAAAQTVRNTIGPSFAMQRAASDISSSSESVRPAKFHVDPNSAFWWAGFRVVGL